MVLKMFGRKAKKDPEDEKALTIEDLVTLERYDEAYEMLKRRVKKVPKDLHAHLKLAEVHVALKNVHKALDEYIFVADSHADDGFFDKAIAVLTKAQKLAPGDEMLPKLIAKYRRMKALEKRRQYAINGLLANKTTGVSTAANSAIQIEVLWNKIAKSHLVEQLPPENLEKLFAAMQMVKTQRGQVLAEDGSTVPVMYLVVDGVIEAGSEINGKYMNIRSFTTGDLIGDAALLERKSWPASYTVTEAGTVFMLGREGLEEVMAGNNDPIGFLSALRQQHHDRDVAASLLRLRSS